MTEDEIREKPLPETRRLDADAVKAMARSPIVIGIVLVIVAILAFNAIRHTFFAPKPAPVETLPPDSFRPTADQLGQLTITPVRYGANAELVRATGSISADGDHSTPILLPYSGQIAQVMVEPGQRVIAGQPLLRIASPELVDARNTLLTAAAGQATAAEALKVAEANATRQKAIYETAGGAMKDYLQAQADLVSARSTLRSADSALRAAQDRLGLFGKTNAETRALESPKQALSSQAATIYRSPVNGIVSDRNVAPGQFISAGAGTPLMTITNPARVWLVAQLPESEANVIRLGDQVMVTTPALPGREFSARIDNIAAALDPNTHRLPVRATVANPDGALKPQMFASFAIQRKLDGGAGVIVPAAAVIHEGDATRVWVLARDGLLHGRAVTIGETDGGLTRIVKGLVPGDRIVTKGAIFVNEAGLES